MEQSMEKIRHSLSHLMSMAIMEKFPKAGLGMGPPIENGFYQDYDLPGTISEKDFGWIEKRMRKMIAQGIDFVQKNDDFDKALSYYKHDPYKTEIINDLKKAGEKKLSFYDSGWFHNLCAGPHVKNTREINPQAFKLTKIAGAYWKGDEKHKMLTRIYGLAFATQKELDDYLIMLAEAEKRDHRKLGKELKIFTFDDLVGPGLPLWLPNGAVIIDQLEKLAKETERQNGYLEVRTPHVAKEEMYLTSGHLPYYKESMFPPMVSEENGVKTVYYLKAMNCPHHHKIYASEPRSYRDLPLRLSEYGTCYRYEKSGELSGLIRVRSMQMNDAHIYCTEEQFEKEFIDVVKLYLKYFKVFGIKKYVMRLSLHSKEGLGKKYIDNESLWLKTEDMVRRAMKKNKIDFVEVPDEAAFYGPKIDVQVWNAIGHEFTLATNQVDFAVPARFGLVYTDKDGQTKTPICLHRAPLSTHERMIGFLIEHYAGAFPTWLSPVQVYITPVGKAHSAPAKKLAKLLQDEGLRVEIDNDNETVGYKVRKAEKQKVPYILVVGDKEAKLKNLFVRLRGVKEMQKMSVKKFVEMIRKEVAERK